MLIKTNMECIGIGMKTEYSPLDCFSSLFQLANMRHAYSVYISVYFFVCRSCARVHVRPSVLPDFPHGRGQGYALCGRHVSILCGLCTVDLLLYAVMRGSRIEDFFPDRFIFFLFSPFTIFVLSSSCQCLSV